MYELWTRSVWEFPEEKIRSTGGKSGWDWDKKYHLDFTCPQCGKEMGANQEDYGG